MLESMKFIYDGISSDDMGVVLVYEGSGTISESLLADRNVITQNIPNNNYPIFKRVEYEPLQFPMTIWIKEWKDRNNLRAIARWLNQSEYKPLIFESNTDHIYYAILNGGSNITHNGNQEGTVNFNVLCDSPYSYSQPITDNISVRTGSVTRSYFNQGDVRIRPQLKITKIDDGGIIIRNNRNNQALLLTGLLDGEVININCETEEIQSSLEASNNRYLFDNHNDVWLDFDFNFFEENTFMFSGSFDCEFTIQYKYLNQDRPIYFE